MSTARPSIDRLVDAGDVELALVERGEGPLVVVLHGFPDSVWSMVPLCETLAAAGFRAVAPAMRGYGPSSLPPGRSTTLLELAGDVLAIADALGEEELMVVGHDWGAGTAHTVATLAPHRVRRIVMAGLPHAHTVLTKPSAKQLWRSRYMLQFQVPGLPERIIRRDGLRWIDDLVRRWSPGWDPTPDQLATIRSGLEGQGRLSAALGYYRGIPRTIADAEARRIALGRVPVPTLVVRGLADACMGAEKFDDLEDRFPGGLRVASLPGVGHHMHVEAPGPFAELVLEHLTAA
ncbi:alpha/beta fold hydrolase [Patulibacter sp.]|uniref:alpha/beta fold hydrolase n=1 Tax=Patulibacter sp. TaxID=1912859 RepID=UPI00271FDEB9|nr:alpha/beta hydrolase [Patulibacter sp.]MDO9409794.1 alpha/beta hydrolase [Patulibacter sp.]